MSRSDDHETAGTGHAERPSQIQNLDLETADRVVRRHLTERYIEHPTRGPFVTSRDLFDAVEDAVDDRFTRQFFGIFCGSRSYLEQWTRGHRGSYQYRIIPEEL